MADFSEMSREELARQVHQHLESLRSAGVAWAPAAPQVIVPETTPPAPAAAPIVPQPIPLAPVEAQVVSHSIPGAAWESRRIELTLLSERVVGCTRCPDLVKSRTRTVFGVGPLGAELCLVGEAPGGEEDAQGVPFVGPAGQLLNRILAACGLKREEVYICNTLKCRPPGNRSPLSEEMSNCREYLERQIELVGPRFICALGGSAIKTILRTTDSIGRLRGRLHDYHGIPVLCTYHPSFLLPHRSKTEEEMKKKKMDVWEDMKFLMAKMGRPV